MAEIRTTLTEAQLKLVRASVPVLKEHGTQVTRLFYSNMIGGHPELKALFSESDQLSGKQAERLANAIYKYASNIDNLKPMMPMINHINKVHVRIGITPAQYDIVGQYLLDAFRTLLGDAWTEELKDAWNAAYQQLAVIMIAKEQLLYASAETVKQNLTGTSSLRALDVK